MIDYNAANWIIVGLAVELGVAGKTAQALALRDFTSKWMVIQGAGILKKFSGDKELVAIMKRVAELQSATTGDIEVEFIPAGKDENQNRGSK